MKPTFAVLFLTFAAPLFVGLPQAGGREVPSPVQEDRGEIGMNASITLHTGSSTQSPDVPVSFTIKADGARFYRIGTRLDPKHEAIVDSHSAEVPYQPFNGTSQTLEYHLSPDDLSPLLLYVQFKDAAGNATRFVHRSFSKDENAFVPCVQFTYNPVWTPVMHPVPKETLSVRSFTVTGTRWSNQQAVHVHAGPLQPDSLTYAGANELEWTAQFSNLPEGQVLFEAWTSKMINGQNKESPRTGRILVIDNYPPRIDIQYPADGAISNTRLIAGRTSPDTISVKVNGIDAQRDDNFWWLDHSLPEGTTPLTIVARDQAGLETSVNRVFQYQAHDDSVRILNLPPNGTVDSDNLWIHGSTTAALGQEIFVEKMRATVDPTGRQFEANDVSIGEGHTVVEAHTVDEKRQRHSTACFIYRDGDGANYRLEGMTKLTELPSAGSVMKFSFKVTDRDRGIAGQKLSFEILEGAGVIKSTDVATNTEGDATVMLQLGPVVGMNRFRARVVDRPGLVVDTEIDTQAAIPAAISVRGPAHDSGSLPGAVVPLKVEVADAHGNAVTDATIEVNAEAGTVANPGAGGVVFTRNLTFEYRGVPRTILFKSGLRAGANRVSLKVAGIPKATAAYQMKTVSAKAPAAKEIERAVAANSAKIKDFTADVHITVSETGKAVKTSVGRSWMKGERSKLQEFSPEPQVIILPMGEWGPDTSGSDQAWVTAVRSKGVYELTSFGTDSMGPIMTVREIDYLKGVVLRERITNARNAESYIESRFSGFQQFPSHENAWVATTDISKSAIEDSTFEMVRTYSNIVLNSGLQDSEFQR